MIEVEKLTAIAAIMRLKAKYFRGVDTNDVELVRSILHEDCVLDYRDAFVDPASGANLLPEYNSSFVRGRAQWSGLGGSIVTAHHGHTAEIEVQAPDAATGIWAMSDRLFFPSGSSSSVIVGYGHYHETYEKVGDSWVIRTLRLTRLRVGHE